MGAVLAKHPHLDFYTPVNEKTGECAPHREAKYRGLIFRIFVSGRVTVEGSLHKLRHGQHNGGNFPAWAVATTIEELACSFGFQPEHAILHTIEFGVNVPLPASATKLLRRAVLYSTAQFDKREFGGKGYYIEIVAEQYYFKLYNKAMHLASLGYRIPNELLRIEFKAVKMQVLRKTGIRTLADLLNPACLMHLGDLLAATFEKVVFAAVKVPPTLAAADRRLLYAGSHPNYWQDLVAHDSLLRKNRIRYRALTAQHVPDELALAATAGLTSQWDWLRTVPPPCPALTGRIGQFSSEVSRVAAAPTTATFHGIYPLYKELKPGAAVGLAGRRCQTCGRDITGQPASSKFCSEALYGKAAKRCRNTASNPRNNMRRAVQRTTQQAYLFDMVPHLHLPATVREFVLSGLSWQVQRA